MKKILTIEVSWKDLEDFLKEHKAYDSYMSNFVKEFKLSEIRSERWLKRWSNSPDWWIDSAFVWDGTEEGHAYWSDLCKKWRELVGVKDAESHFSCDATTLIGDVTAAYKLHVDQTLTGTWYKVHDFSYNRDALPEWESDIWEEDHYATEIGCDKKLGPDDKVLVVEPPVVKTIRFRHGEDTKDHKVMMIKVYVPEYKKLHWFFHRPI